MLKHGKQTRVLLLCALQLNWHQLRPVGRDAMACLRTAIELHLLRPVGRDEVKCSGTMHLVNADQNVTIQLRGYYSCVEA